MMSKKSHWFSFTFRDSDESGRTITASSYSGYETKNISIPIINKNKEFAGVSKASVLSNLSYLGYMREEEAKGQE